MRSDVFKLPQLANGRAGTPGLQVQPGGSRAPLVTLRRRENSGMSTGISREIVILLSIRTREFSQIPRFLRNVDNSLEFPQDSCSSLKDILPR